MTKVMMIFPPFTQPTESKKRCLVPLGVTYIASYLRENGIDVRLLDCVVEGYYNDSISPDGTERTFGLGLEDIKERLFEYKPDFVGISCLMTAQEHNVLAVCDVSKTVNPECKTIIGGCHASVFSKQLLSHKSIDNIVIGEGEQATLDIVQGKDKGIVKKKLMDIDKIPWPARDLLPMEKYFEINMPENIFSPNNRVTQMVTSRGCPFKCSFCATTNFHGNWRGRSAQNVVDEIKMLKEKYNIDEVNFIDENLVLKRDRTIEIMKGLDGLDIAWSNPGGIWIDGLDNEVLELMKKAGCYQLTFPVETFNKKVLKDTINKPLRVERVEPLVKKCHELEIDVHAFFICGFPEQTKDMMENDFKMASKVEFDSASFHMITPLPGSKLYMKYKDKINLNEINYVHATIPHPELKKHELEKLVDSFNVNFNKLYEQRHPDKFYEKYVLIPDKKRFSDPFRRV